MTRLPLFLASLCTFGLPLAPFQGGAADKDALSRPALPDVLAEEVRYGMEHLRAEGDVKPYYLAYTVTETTSVNVQARLGALQSSDSSRARILDTDLRVGSHALDNTRTIRGSRGGGALARFLSGATPIALDDEPAAIRQAIWKATEASFAAAVERYKQVLTSTQTTIQGETPCDDFSKEEPSVASEPDVKLTLDRNAWASRAKRVSAIALEHPEIDSSGVSVVGTAENRVLVSSEGTRVKTGRKLLRVVVSASSRAEDGMELSQSHIFNAATEDRLPGEEEVAAAFRKVIRQVLDLRKAPVVEPYTGPAILLNRASGVFFHEIFGHRIEGHRQKNEDEGQTFTKMVGEPVLPSFLSVVDDPTLKRYGEEDLRGFYTFDDEGIPAQRVVLVDKGVLKTFLLSRSPVPGFAKSNGHGRREPGRDAVSRQGNLMVLSTRSMPYDKLRAELVELCRKQGKPFGLLFDDITGGFTTTTRGGPQAFKVQPVVVYRIYADGRSDELVRGVDIVGTPLSCFSRILATADDTAVFNGTCGAESGWVPVTAISPSILVEQIEIEKKQTSAERAPLLASPLGVKPTPPKDAEAGAEADTLVQALEDELARHASLSLPDVGAPYYVSYRVVDRKAHAIAATLGAVVRSEPSRSRTLRTDVRVGSYDLDNSNFGGEGGFPGAGGGRRPGGAPSGFGGGGGVALPDEDDYTAIRQVAWRATDAAYKSAVETLAQKKSFLEGRMKEDRHADFSKADPVKSMMARASFTCDASAWEERLRSVSERFARYKDLTDAGVDFQAFAETETFLDSEGTRLRIPSARATIVLRAETLTDDGERLSDRIVHVADTAANLPSTEALVADVDRLAARLASVKGAARLKEYSGPVLFDGLASPQLFHGLLARGVAAQPTDAGGGRRRASPDGLDKYLGKRLLPASFRIFDDPTAARHEGQFLAGHYDFDDEGVRATRVELVKDGKLVGFVASRTPTPHTSASTGHGRGGRSTIGNLFVECSDGLSDAALRAKLLETAKEQGLEYGIRVSAFSSVNPGVGLAAAMRLAGRGGRGGGAAGAAGGGRSPGSVPDPLVVTRVYVKDGREEAIRGCEIDGLTAGSLKDILAAGRSHAVWNVTGASAASVVAPPVLFETLSLYGVEAASEKPPALSTPLAR